MPNRFQPLIDQFRDDAKNAQAAYKARKDEIFRDRADGFTIAADALEKAGQEENR